MTSKDRGWGGSTLESQELARATSCWFGTSKIRALIWFGEFVAIRVAQKLLQNDELLPCCLAGPLVFTTAISHPAIAPFSIALLLADLDTDAFTKLGEPDLSVMLAQPMTTFASRLKTKKKLPIRASIFALLRSLQELAWLTLMTSHFWWPPEFTDSRYCPPCCRKSTSCARCVAQTGEKPRCDPLLLRLCTRSQTPALHRQFQQLHPIVLHIRELFDLHKRYKMMLVCVCGDACLDFG
jgi:hypothetical protein